MNKNEAKMKRYGCLFGMFTAFLLLVQGCGNFNVRPESVPAMLTNNQSFVYGTYFFDSWQYGSYLAFAVTREGSSPFYIRLNGEKGYFLNNLEPGKYLISGVVNINSEDNRPFPLYETIPLDVELNLSPKQVVYLGSFRLYNSFQHLYTDFSGSTARVEYGISNVFSRLKEDKITLLSNYPALSNAAIIDMTLKQ